MADPFCNRMLCSLLLCKQDQCQGETGEKKENGSLTDGLVTVRCEADVRQKPSASGSCHLCSLCPSDVVALTLRIKLSASIGKQKVPEEMWCLQHMAAQVASLVIEVCVWHRASWRPQGEC